MKPTSHHTLALLSGFLLVAAALPLTAQESIVGLGKVISNGVLESSASPAGATVACIRNSTGSYNLSFAAPGAFAGAAESDFMVETTINYVNSGDRSCIASVISLTDDLLTVRVRVHDLEDAAIPEVGVAADSDFVFVVRRLDVLAGGSPMPTRHLLAAGNARGNGVLESGFGVGGVALSSVRAGLGNYSLDLSKAGAFTADAHAHYVLLLSIRNIALPDGAIRGGSYYVGDDDYVRFVIRTDDVQAATPSISAVPVDAPFAFAVYRVVSNDSDGVPASTLLSVAASVEGDTGNLVRGRAAFAGATVSSIRNSTGRYDVFVDAPGAFAGVDSIRFAAFVTLNSSSPLHDDIAKARVVVENADRIRIDVKVDDVQHIGDDDGIPADGSFFLTVYDTSPVFRHDLRVGSNVSGIGAIGAGVINTNGVGQSLRFRLPGRARRSTFHCSENAGQAIDDLSLQTGKISRRVNFSVFVTSGQYRNITAETQTGAIIERELRPGDAVTMQADFRYRKLKKRPKASIFLHSFSGFQPANQDTNSVSLKAK